MTISSVKIKRSDQHSTRRQLNLIPRSFSASPIFERKSPGTRLALTYAVKGAGMRRSDTRQSQSSSDKDGALTALTWLVPTCLRWASTSARTRVVWWHSPRASRDEWGRASVRAHYNSDHSLELLHSTRTGVWNTGAHIRGVISQHSDTRVKHRGTYQGSCFTAFGHASEKQGHISEELFHSTRTGVWNKRVHIRGVISQHTNKLVNTRASRAKLS